MMNIFLSFFRRSKLDQSLADRVAELETKARYQAAENHASFASKCELAQQLAVAVEKIAKLESSNRRLQSRVLRLHLEIKASDQASENFAADLSKAIKDSAIKFINDIGKPLISSTFQLELPPTTKGTENYTYEPKSSMPTVEWLDQTYHTVADYYAGHLPHWAAKHVTQQSLTYRVSKLAETGHMPVQPIAVKTAARTMARSWPAWLLEKAAAWVTLDKGGVIPSKNGFDSLRKSPGDL